MFSEQSNTVATSLLDILSYRAQYQADRQAYVFLQNGETESGSLTYGELDRQARAIAAQIQSWQGERALLLYPSGLEFITAFFGCLYAGVIAVPVYPPRRNQNLSRLLSIVNDAQAKIALTSESILKDIDQSWEKQPELSRLKLIATDTLAASSQEEFSPQLVAPETLAFLQYTSGSTGTPKGVMVSHGNIIHNQKLIQQAFSHSDTTIFVGWLPLFHDMGLIGNVLQPMYLGIPCILMPPVAFLQKPIRWLQAISKYRATTSGGPNFAYDLCVNQIRSAELADLDLSSWDLAFSGAEPVRAETLKRFGDKFAECGFSYQAFYPCYGMAECTLLATGGNKYQTPVINEFKTSDIKENLAVKSDVLSLDSRLFVGCGRAHLETTAIIVDPESLTRCQPGQIGEIWIAGGSVAAGYWHRPKITQETFKAFLQDTGEGPFLRTGDLGFSDNEELFITGRLKDLIIIRGRNYYPQDIELTIERSHPAIRENSSATFAIDLAEGEGLVVVCEVERTYLRKLNVDEIVRAIKIAVSAEHELDLHGVILLKTGSIPKTSSGKIQRHACKAGFLENSLNNVVDRWQESHSQILTGSLDSLSNNQIDRDSSPTTAEIAIWLANQIAQMQQIPLNSIDLKQPLAVYGLSSIKAVSISAKLGEWLGKSIEPTIVYDYPSIQGLANHLGLQASTCNALPMVAYQQTKNEAIAIVGKGCRFPQADCPEAFWSLLSSGQDAITKVPISRWESANDWGGFLDRIDSFDPQFFNISPQEANNIDPQQRLLLEVSWEALENAALSAEKLAGSQSGVFVGISGGDYSRLSENLIDPPMYYVTGNALSIAANRLSYFLDWHGPSWAVDTACSSSLVAVHQACQSLLMGECNLALAGGVNLILSPQLTLTFSEAQMMATDGRCKTFDASADGYVRSEGCGVVVLKRLSDAIADGDNIQAIIKGSAVNQDGLTNGITAPNGTSQREVIRLALAKAGIEPNLISYVETHGTGTALGDPIEVNSLKAVLMEERKSDRPCWIGSVKTNIGHLEAAAGIAGLIKTVLSLEYGAIPPHLHFDRLNPYIKLDRTPIKIPTQLQPWVAGEHPRLAGVSAFGFGGTNAHIVLEEAPVQFKLQNIPSEDRNLLNYQHEDLKNLPERPIHLLTLSAKCEKALKDLVFSYKNHLEKNEHLDIASICFSAHIGRSHFSHRLAIVAANKKELVDKLAKISLEEDNSIFIGKSHTNSKLLKMAFLFTGQGCQYINMGRQLYETQPVFRRVINQCDRILRSYLEKSLLDVIYPENAQEGLDISLIDQTAYTQPALFAVEYALCELWQSWGVKPAAVMGHSVGEYVAACVAGVFTLADGLKLIAARGRLMQSLPANGGMLAVFADRSIVDSILADWSQDVVIAGFNGPANYVLSGSEKALNQIERQLQIQGVKAVLLSVSHAFHSPLMEPILAEFEQIAQTVTFQLPKLELISNLTGGVVDREMSSSDYWVRHIREAVKFSQGMETLADRGYEIFIECGAKPILLGMGHKCLPEGASLWLPSLRSSVSDWQQLLESLGQLYVAGVKIDWQGFEHYYPKFPALLPTYPFQRQSYWLPSTAKEEKYLAQKKWHPQDWFYQWSWQPEDLVKVGELPVDGIIILANDSIEKKSLKQSLGDNLYFIILGQEFNQISEREFVINSDCFADYVSVIKTIQQNGGKLSTAIHLGNISTTLKLQNRQEIALFQSQELQQSVFDVLFLIQALLQEATSCQKLLLVTQGAYTCTSSESLNSLYQAMGGVLVQSCSQEHNRIQGQIIDLPSGDSYEGESLAQLIAQELTAKPSVEGVVAIRQQRLVRTLIPSLPAEPAALQSLAICEGDTWLITGGLSEVGQAIAKGLAAKAKINLVLTGRSPLPPRQDWAMLQEQATPMAKRFTTIEALEQLGANVIYQVVDITNLEQMEHLMVAIKEQFGELNGVIQAAGILDTQALNIQDKTPEIFASVLAPKVQGTLILDWVTRDEPLKYFMLLSSVTASAIEWSGNLSDYAAANTFLDNYASYRHQQKATGKSLALNFSLWKETGMARIGGADLVAIAKARGVDVLDPDRAVLSSIDAMATYSNPVVHIINFISPQPLAVDRVKTQEVVTDTQYQGLLVAGKSQRIYSLVWQILGQYLPQAQFDGSQTFSELGLDSLGAIGAIRKISTLFNIELSPTTLFGYPTPDALINYLEELYQQVEINHVKQSLLSETSQNLNVQPKQTNASQDIAIIGIGCKVPGADNLEQFWQLLNQEQSRISDVPTERWGSDDYFDAQGRDPHKTYCKQGGFIDNPYDFDALFFGISPREAMAMDPQQRLFLEVTWQALQQAGYGGRSRPKEVGVFVGCGQNNYVDRFINAGYYELMLQKFAASQSLSTLTEEQKIQLGDILTQVLQPSEMLPEIAAGNELNEIAARVSHCLDLNGPSLGINTACSSSLVALHLACESLRKGESLMAIAGGVNLNLSPTPFVALSRVGALSPTGTCYPFDDRANGIIIGDGVGAVLLKPLSAAMQDGDFIHAIIKGSAMNNDGYSQGITAPNPRGQAQAIRNAYLNSGIDPETISYIETHGTGTALGDPIEIEGMTQAFRHFTQQSSFCGIGSVKSAIGHSLSAAGIVSLIKVVLAMQHGKLPGTLGFETPNRHINFEQTPFYVVGQAGMNWQDSEQPRRAGINGFGFGGTNCHVILEQAPTQTDVTPELSLSNPYLLCLKGRNQDSLRQVARDLSIHLSQHPELSELQVCATFNQAQRELAHKAAFVASNRAQLISTLTEIAQGCQPQTVHFHHCNPKRSTPIYLLLDETSPFTAADITLLRQRFAAFETAYHHCEQTFARVISPTNSQDATKLIGQIDSFAQQYALGTLLMSLKVTPTSIHATGIGILVGACLGGMLSLDRAMTLLLQLEAKQVEPLKTLIHENRPQSSWNVALITTQGSFQYPLQFDSKQLESLLQSSSSLQFQQIRSNNTQLGVYLYTGSSIALKDQLNSGEEESTLWVELTAQLPVVERLLTLLGRLSVFGVWFDSKALFPSSIRSVPLPTYPFERKTYKPPILHSSLTTKSALAISQFPVDVVETLSIEANDVCLPPLSQLPTLTNQSRALSYLALSDELRKFSSMS